MACGIYEIKNQETGAAYVGQATDIETRKKTHFSNLRKHIHANSAFQKSYDESGEDAFSFRVILYCERFELNRYERAIITSEKPSINKITRWSAAPERFGCISKTSSADEKAKEFEWCEAFYKKAIVITDKKEWNNFVSENFSDLMRFYESRPQYRKPKDKKS